MTAVPPAATATAPPVPATATATATPTPALQGNLAPNAPTTNAHPPAASRSTQPPHGQPAAPAPHPIKAAPDGIAPQHPAIGKSRIPAVGGSRGPAPTSPAKVIVHKPGQKATAHPPIIIPHLPNTGDGGAFYGDRRGTWYPLASLLLGLLVFFRRPLVSLITRRSRRE
jgi:hypothetical protein